MSFDVDRVSEVKALAPILWKRSSNASPLPKASDVERTATVVMIEEKVLGARRVDGKSEC